MALHFLYMAQESSLLTLTENDLVQSTNIPEDGSVAQQLCVMLTSSLGAADFRTAVVDSCYGQLWIPRVKDC